MKLKLLISPLALGAYFDAVAQVAIHEFTALFPGAEATCTTVGGMQFLNVDVDGKQIPALARLSFVQGIFEHTDNNALVPLPFVDGFALPRELVFGAKYQGKTNELLTGLAINLALHHCATGTAPRTLLDPMAGRGTTLLWAVRYGLNAVGIEREEKAVEAFYAHVKKQTKVHRIKHKHQKGKTGKKGKGQHGFHLFEMGDGRMQMIGGNSKSAPQLIGNRVFDMLVTDLPYGVQFKGQHKRNPLDIIKSCAPAWVESLKPGGVMVLSFNTYQPAKAQLAAVFESHGLAALPFAAPHRMSESIVRDILILKKQPAK